MSSQEILDSKYTGSRVEQSNQKAANLASKEYQLGQTVEVSISHEDEQCHGIASVQSIRDFGNGRIRYGMRAIEEDPHTGEFLRVMQRISLAVQRELRSDVRRCTPPAAHDSEHTSLSAGLGLRI